MAKERRHGGDNCCTKQETYNNKKNEPACESCGRAYDKKVQETECACMKDNCDHCGYED